MINCLNLEDLWEIKSSLQAGGRLEHTYAALDLARLRISSVLGARDHILQREDPGSHGKRLHTSTQTQERTGLLDRHHHVRIAHMS